MSDVTRYLTYRGELRGFAADGGAVVLVTVHPEGQATALYRIELESQEMRQAALPCGGESLALTATGDHYVGGSDGMIYSHRWDHSGALARPLTPEPLGAPILGLAGVDDGRLAAIAGDSLFLLRRQDGAILQRLPLPEPGVSLAVDPRGAWIAVGGRRGTLAVFDGEEKPEFVAAEARAVHEGPILALLFEPDEPRVLSAGTDTKIFLTHVRGALDPELRSGRSGHDEATTCLTHGTGNTTYSGGRDKVVKVWTRGQGRSSTLKGLPPVVGLALVAHKGRPSLAIAGDDASIRVYALDPSNGKPSDRLLTLHGAAAWARNGRGHPEPKSRSKTLRTIAAWNDAVAIDNLQAAAQSDSDHALKVLATELLGASGNPRAKAPLGELLRAPSAAIRLRALAGLRALEGERALRPLTLALAAEQRDVGVAAIRGLAALATADDLARDRLIEALGARPVEVRTAALLALESLHPAESPEADLMGLRSTEADLRRLALLRLWQRGMTGRPEVLAALRRHAADSDADVRRVAFLISLLAQPRLAAALRSRDRQLHRALHDLETEAPPTLAADLDDDPSAAKPTKKSDKNADKKTDKKAELPKAPKVDLATVTEPDKRPLLEAMASRALDTCLAGARGLALLGDPRALGTLLQLSRERDAGVRVEVCRALQTLGDPRGAARLRLLIRDREASVRDAAFSALVKLGATAPLEIVEAGLLAEHEDIRRRGLDLLVKRLREPGATTGDSKDKDQDPAIALLERALGDAAKNVRFEAFKAVLNLEIAGGGADSLRFAQRSPHADLRREVLGEVIGQIDEPWAQSLLLECFHDPDPGVRSEAFEFAIKRTKGTGEEPLRAALGGPYVDLRLAATEHLSRRRAPGVHELLAVAAVDSDEAVRRLAVDALLVNDADDALVAAMASPHPDVVVRAAAARATHGDPRALGALLRVVDEPEPEIPALQKKWRERVLAGLGGLAELGDPGALQAASPFLKSKDADLRRAAIGALAAAARPDDRESLAALEAALAHDDPKVSAGAALGLALCGELSGASILFSGTGTGRGDDALLAALALGDRARDVFMAFLDHSEARIRDKAMLLMLLLELTEDDGVPDRSLAALSAANPRVRLAAAQALENFADREAFFAFVVHQINDRGEGKAPWTIAPEVVSLLGEAITGGDASGNPQFKARAAALLDTLFDTPHDPKHDPKQDPKQEAWDRRWRIFTERYSDTLAALQTRSRMRPPVTSVYSPEELRALVFGAYAGLSRLAGGAAEARIRQTAIARLVAVARAGWAAHDAVFAVLVPALGDSQAAVRTLAFDSLRDLGMPPATLATEAIGAGQRDVGGLGLDLLARSGGQSAGAAVLEEVVRENTDGLELEAARLLAAFRAGLDPQQSAGPSEEESAALAAAWIPVHRLALGARSENLRRDALRGLTGAYEAGGAGPAADALRLALGSKHREVRFAAAEALAERGDRAAFPVLVERLASENAREQGAAIRQLTRLGDPRTPAALLDRIDDDPAGTAAAEPLLQGAGALRRTEIVDRLLGYLEHEGRRAAAAAAIVTISGHDQKIEDPEDSEEKSPATPGWEARQHPRHDGVLIRLLDALRHLGDERLLTGLLPAATWARDPAIDGALSPLLSYSKGDLRNRAITALAWRLRKRGANKAPLVAALQSGDPQSQFLAAEGLARAGHAEGIATLLAAVDMMPELPLRIRAVQALGYLADARALDLLLRLATEEGHALQEQAAEALGHLRQAAPDRADRIFGVLRSLARSDQLGVARQALTGLRYFGGRDAWALIRAMAVHDNPALRERAVELLAHDDSPETRELLAGRLRDDTTTRVWEAAGRSLRDLLRRVDGEDTVEPDYAFLESLQPLRLQPDLIDRLRDRGDPARILALLPRVKNLQLHEPLITLLTTRDPLPVDAAVASLGSSRSLTVAVAARILGSAGPAIADAHGPALVAACERWAADWAAEIALLTGTLTLDPGASDSDAEAGKPGKAGKAGNLGSLVDPYHRLLWACGRVGIGDHLLVAATKAAGDDPRGRVIRRAGVLGLASASGPLTSVARGGLEGLARGGDAELRSLAAAALAGRDTAAAAALVGDLLDDSVSVHRLLTGDGQRAAQAALREAAGDLHRQGVALPHLVALGDSDGLADGLADRNLREVLRLGLIEALARIADDPALDHLRALGRDTDEDEELRRAAWRALRRGQRRRAAALRPPRRSRWEVQP